MSRLTFRDLGFSEKKEFVRVNFLKIFYFDIPKEQLDDMKPYKIDGHSIEFPKLSEDVARRKFLHILEQGFQRLRNILNNKPTVYVHKKSGIPLIGNVSFGIIDRNTTLIEVKPITGCNLNCIYCSVDETKRSRDFVVEESYIVEQLKKLVDFKEEDALEIHINAHGEPLYYEPLEDFISHISKWPEVKTISIDTNATILTKQKIDKLVKAGLTRFNVSLNALTQKLARKIAGANYNVERIKQICKYIANKSELLIAPVLIPGVNDAEIPKLVELAQSLNARMGIQNFLSYRHGRNPVKPESMKKFYEQLMQLEHKHDTKLILNERDFGIRKTKNLPKPFKKGQKIIASIVCTGRMEREVIAVANDRSIAVTNCDKSSGTIKVKITRDKHNIFYGVPIR